MTNLRQFGGDVALATLAAGTLSGIPSTVHALVTRRSSLRAARAAGELLGRPGLWRGALAHAAISVAWTGVLRIVLPAGYRVPAGAMAGLAIAGADLAIADRRFPDIAALPRVPQIVDHVAFGALVGAVLDVRSRRRSSGDRPAARR